MDLIPERLRIPKEDLKEEAFLKAGACGAVFRGTWKKDGALEVVAIKMVKTSRDVIEDVCRELNTMASFDNENICKVHGACMNNSDLWIILKFADGGNFHDYTKGRSPPLSFPQQLSFALQAAKSVEHLHSNEFLHRDVKSLNFLVHENSLLMLTDFGFSTAKARLGVKEECGGTLRWQAPETLENQANWSEKSDIYSLGMFFYEIVSGSVPYKEEEGRDVLFEKIKNGVTPKIPKCPVEFKSIIELCWRTNPQERPTASELVQMLTELEATLHADSPKRTKKKSNSASVLTKFLGYFEPK